MSQRLNGSFCGAWCWIPLLTISFLLKLRTHDKRLLEVERIVDGRGNQQKLAAARKRCHIEVLRNGGVLAVRNAILSQISGSQVGCCHLQRRWFLPLRG